MKTISKMWVMIMMRKGMIMDTVVVDVVHQWVQEWTAEEVQDQVPAVAAG
jgi:hypothetical protein